MLGRCRLYLNTQCPAGWKIPTRLPPGLLSYSNGAALPKTSLASTNNTEVVSKLDDDPILHRFSDSSQLTGSRASKTCVLGIDSDLSGAVALIELECNEVVDIQNLHFETIDTPLEEVESTRTRKRRQVGAVRVSAIIEDILRKGYGTIKAFLEKPAPLPMNGSISNFLSGINLGVWYGVLAANHIETKLVFAGKWKRDLNLFRKDKSQSRELAMSLFPASSEFLRRKKDHGRAEALLIAYWGAKYGEKYPCFVEDTRVAQYWQRGKFKADENGVDVENLNILDERAVEDAKGTISDKMRPNNSEESIEVIKGIAAQEVTEAAVSSSHHGYGNHAEAEEAVGHGDAHEVSSTSESDEKIIERRKSGVKFQKSFPVEVNLQTFSCSEAVVNAQLADTIHQVRHRVLSDLEKWKDWKIQDSSEGNT